MCGEQDGLKEETTEHGRRLGKPSCHLMVVHEDLV